VMVPAVGAVIREFAPADGRIVVDADGLGLDEAPRVRKPRGRRTTKAARSSAPVVPVSGDAPAAEDAPDADAAAPEADGAEPA